MGIERVDDAEPLADALRVPEVETVPDAEKELLAVGLVVKLELAVMLGLVLGVIDTDKVGVAREIV